MTEARGTLAAQANIRLQPTAAAIMNRRAEGDCQASTEGSTMKPKWFLLLEEQRCGQGLGPSGPATTQRLGLTVTFLIGALRQLPGGELASEPTVVEIRGLLAEMMIQAADPSVVRIYECDKLREPTVCLSDSRSGSLGDSVVFPDGSSSRLHAWPQYFSGGPRDLESISQCLWGLLGEPLRRREFLHRLGSYKEFNDDDCAFIARALARDDDEELG